MTAKIVDLQVIRGDKELTEAFARADAIFDQLLDDTDNYPEEAGAVLYSLWNSLTRFLVETGWTPDELIRDVTYHANDQAKERP